MLVKPLETINGPLETTNGPLDIKEQGSEQSSRSDGKSAREDVIDETRGGGHDDDATRDGAADVSIDWSKMGKVDEISALTDVESNIDIAIQQFYSNVELGFEVFPCFADAVEQSQKLINSGLKRGLQSGFIGTTIKDITTSASDVHIHDNFCFCNESSEDDILDNFCDESSEDDILDNFYDAVVGSNIDTAIQQFYSNVELGFEVFPCFADAVEQSQKLINSGLKRGLQSGFIGTTIKDITTSASDVHIHDNFCFCNESSEDDILDNFCDESSEDDILDKFYDESSEDDITLVTMETRKLLDEIKDIEETLQWQVRKCSSLKDMTEVKKRQVPYLQQVSTIRQRLLEQQELLKSVPKDTKKKYYNAVSKAAGSAQRCAELELKKIRLESMMVVPSQMGRICYRPPAPLSIAQDSTCSAPVSVSVTADSRLTFETDKQTSVDDSMSHGVSDGIAFFTPIKKLRGRGRKNKGRLRHVASTLKNWITSSE